MACYLAKSTGPTRLSKSFNLVSFLLVAGISLAMPAFTWPLALRVMIALLLLIPGTFLLVTNVALFVPSLFFVVNALLNPFVLLALKRLPFQVPQLYFLPSIAVYMVITLSIPSVRQHLHWLRFGKINRITIFLIVVLVIVSALSIAGWTLFIARGLSRFREFVPHATIPVLVVYGLAFALMNSCFEEFLARAVLFDGFSSLLKNIAAVVIAQAIVFSLWHFHGFPGGPIGVGMVFLWSVFLGVIRHTSDGMLAPAIAHFFADLTIAVMVLFVLVLPNLG